MYGGWSLNNLLTIFLVIFKIEKRKLGCFQKINYYFFISFLEKSSSQLNPYFWKYNSKLYSVHNTVDIYFLCDRFRNYHIFLTYNEALLLSFTFKTSSSHPICLLYNRMSFVIVWISLHIWSDSIHTAHLEISEF